MSSDPREPAPGAAPLVEGEQAAYRVDAAGDPPDRQASNWLTVAPEVEREFSALNRGYEQLTAQYSEVESKLREAEIALNLESELRGGAVRQSRAERRRPVAARAQQL